MGVYAHCPFFRSENKNLTYCEYAKLHPPDKEARDEIMFNYCANEKNYKTCPFYIALEHYYERVYKEEEAKT